MKKLLFILAIGYQLLAISFNANAQLTDILTFNGANGKQPDGSLIRSGYKFYGMASIGGAYDEGCVFSMDTNGSGYKDIYDFDGTNGSRPLGSLLLVGKFLYGMTELGGISSYGCVFSIDTNGGEYNDRFNFTNTNGSNPHGSLIASPTTDQLFGMTSSGGTNSDGVVFSIDTNGTKYKEVLVFNSTNGATPLGSLVLSGNKLYGMTEYGGTHNAGVVFDIDSNGNNYHDMLDFDTNNGAQPHGSLILSGNRLYGMTSIGGSTYQDGNIFSIKTNGNGYNNIYKFKGSDGALPYGDLSISHGILYGMTSDGAGVGNIFSIDSLGHLYGNLFNFNQTDGQAPYAGLTISGDVFYGTTMLGGVSDSGVVFRFYDTTINLSINTTKYFCNGVAGTATVSATGAEPPFTYLWNPGGVTTTTATGLSAGTYTVTVTGYTGRVKTGTAVISKDTSFVTAYSPSEIEAGDSVELVGFFDNSSFAGSWAWTLSGTVTDPTSPYTYVHPTTTTIYTVTSTTGCGSYFDTVTVQLGCTLSLRETVTPYYCILSKGEIDVTPHNGVSPYTYVWSAPGHTSDTASRLNIGTYTVTVHDKNGCIATAVNTIVKDTSYVVAYSASRIETGDSVSLFALFDNSSASGLWVWTPSASVTDPNSPISFVHPTSTTTYTVTDITACGAFFDTVTVQVGCNIHLNQHIYPYYCSANAGEISVIPYDGVSPYTYVWSAAGHTSDTAKNLAPGSYTVTVSDKNGCSATANDTVKKDTSFVTAFSATRIESGDTASLYALFDSSFSPYGTWAWTPSSSVINPYSAHTKVHPATTTVYTVTNTNVCGTLTDTVTVQVGCNIHLSESVLPYFCPASLGEMMVTPSLGLAPYTYTWSAAGHTSDTATHLGIGVYTVTVSDKNGCSATASDTISKDTLFVTAYSATRIESGDSALLFAFVDNSSEAGTWSWSPSSSVTDPTSPYPYVHPTTTTVYTVTYTTACGGFSDTVIVQVGCNIHLSYYTDPYMCPASPGKFVVTAHNGLVPYTYTWSAPGHTSDTATNLSGGNYTVTVGDKNGCTAMAEDSVISGTLMVDAYSATRIELGDSTQLYALLDNTSAAGSWSWTPSASVTDPHSFYTYVHPTTTTVYTVTNTTVCGTVSDTVTVQVGCNIQLSSSITSYQCPLWGGTIAVIANDGLEPYTYSWSPGGATTDSIGNLSAGAYTVTVQDKNGCPTIAIDSVHKDSSFITAYYATDVEIGDSTFLYALFENTSSYIGTWSWAPSVSVSSPTSPNTYVHPVVTTIYTVTNTTVCGSFSDTVTVFAVGCNVHAYYYTNPYLCPASPGEFVALPSGGLAPYTYAWSIPGHTSDTATNLSSGTYTVTIYDKKGCTDTIVDSVIGGTLMLDVYSATCIELGDSAQLYALLDNTSAQGSWTWSPSASVTNPTSWYTYVHPTTTTVYTVTNTNACDTLTDTVTVQVGCNIHVNNRITPYLCADSMGTITGAAFDGLAPYTYSWSPGGATTANISGLSAGIYTLTVNDKNSCSTIVYDTVQNNSFSIVLYASTTSIAPGDSAYLEALDNSSFSGAWQWFPSGSVSQPDSFYTFVHPTATTVYTVTNTTICGDITDTITIFVINTGVPKISAISNNVTVYPNPNSGKFTMQSSVVGGQLSVEIYNILGEAIYSNYQITKISNYQIDLSSQPSGIYLYRVVEENGSLIGEGKIVITK